MWLARCRGGALVAIDTGFMGPNYSISTACATANYAFVAAANHIRKGEADVMLVGGSEAPIIPVGLGGFVACRCASLAANHAQHASASRLHRLCRCSCCGRDPQQGAARGMLVGSSGAPIITVGLGGFVACWWSYLQTSHNNHHTPKLLGCTYTSIHGQHSLLVLRMCLSPPSDSCHDFMSWRRWHP